MSSVDLATLTNLRTLEQVFRFAMQQSPRWTFADVVTQDEYTHEVQVCVDENTVLVFDTT